MPAARLTCVALLRAFDDGKRWASSKPVWEPSAEMPPSLPRNEDGTKAIADSMTRDKSIAESSTRKYWDDGAHGCPWACESGLSSRCVLTLLSAGLLVWRASGRTTFPLPVGWLLLLLRTPTVLAQSQSPPPSSWDYTFSFEGSRPPSGWVTGVTGYPWTCTSGWTPTVKHPAVRRWVTGSYYMYTETSSPRVYGDLFDLAGTVQHENNLSSDFLEFGLASVTMVDESQRRKPAVRPGTLARLEDIFAKDGLTLCKDMNGRFRLQKNDNERACGVSKPTKVRDVSQSDSQLPLHTLLPASLAVPSPRRMRPSPRRTLQRMSNSQMTSVRFANMPPLRIRAFAICTHLSWGALDELCDPSLVCDPPHNPG